MKDFAANQKSRFELLLKLALLLRPKEGPIVWH
jgi:hypothetical protein